MQFDKSWVSFRCENRLWLCKWQFRKRFLESLTATILSETGEQIYLYLSSLFMSYSGCPLPLVIPFVTPFSLQWVWYCISPPQPDLQSGKKTNSLQWRHSERDGVWNHQPHDCLLNRLFRHRSTKTSKLRVTGLCEGNSSVTGEFPTQGPVTRKMFPFDDVIMNKYHGYLCWPRVWHFSMGCNYSVIPTLPQRFSCGRIFIDSVSTRRNALSNTVEPILVPVSI